MTQNNENSLPSPRKDGFLINLTDRSYDISGINKKNGEISIVIKLKYGKYELIEKLGNIYSSRQRNRFSTLANKRLGINVETVEYDLCKLIDAIENFNIYQPQKENDDKPEYSEKEKDEVLQWAKSPNLLNSIIQDYRELGICGEENNIILSYLTMTSRLMDEPLALLLLSSSSSGKSAIQNVTVNKLCPPDDSISLSSATPRTLFYKEESISHKCLCIEELAGLGFSKDFDVLYPIRSLISQGKLIVEAVVVDQSGKLTTLTVKKNGPTALMLTTVRQFSLDSETKSRFIVSNLDESKTQTNRIHEAQKRTQTLDFLLNKEKAEKIIRRHHIFQALLKERKLKIVNPFAEYLQFSSAKVEFRREFSKYLRIIQVFAFLRQFSRDCKGFKKTDGKTTVHYIEVSLDDIDKANKLYSSIAHSISLEISAASLELIKALQEMVNNPLVELDELKRFSRKQIREYAGISQYKCHVLVADLVKADMLLKSGKGENGGFLYKINCDNEELNNPEKTLGLISVDEIKAKLAERKI